MIKGNRHLCKPYTPQSVHAPQGYNQARRHSTNQRITRRRSVTTPQKTIKRNDNDSNRSLAHCASSTSPAVKRMQTNLVPSEPCKPQGGCNARGYKHKRKGFDQKRQVRRQVVRSEEKGTDTSGQNKEDRYRHKWSNQGSQVQTHVVKINQTCTDTSRQIKEDRYRHKWLNHHVRGFEWNCRVSRCRHEGMQITKGKEEDMQAVLGANVLNTGK